MKPPTCRECKSTDYVELQWVCEQCGGRDAAMEVEDELARLTAENKTMRELLREVNFKVVVGDAARLVNPDSHLNLNTTATWIVAYSSEIRHRHVAQKWIDELRAMLGGE